MKNLVIIFLAALSLSACGSRDSDSREGEADILFEHLKTLTRAYCDSMKLARDSARANALFERYEAAFEKCSFQVSPDTDLFLNEGQNDTIRFLQRRLLEIRQDVLSAHQMHLAPDTIKAEPEFVPAAD